MALAMRPRATITEQKLPKVWRGLKPWTISAPWPLSYAVAYSGCAVMPDARPMPQRKARVKDVRRPKSESKKSLVLDVRSG